MADNNKIKWTQQQRQAVTQRAGDIIVTASAGTGKTAVLSRRCVDIVTDKNICADIWNMLVLTFTEAAAEQMRSRIAGQLNAAFESGHDRHIRNQLMLLPAADISTIHAFCKRLIAENFYQLGIDPAFGIIDADEQKLLKAEVLEQTVEWAWRQSNLRQGLSQLLYRRDLRLSDGFVSKVIEISNFLDGVIDRDNWYERAALTGKIVEPAKKQKQLIARKLETILAQLCQVQKLYEKEGDNSQWAEKFSDNFIDPVSKCVDAFRAENWNSCFEKIREHDWPRFNKPKDIPEVIVDVIKQTIGQAGKAFKQLKELAVVNPEYTERIGGAVGLQARIMVELIKKFDRLYSQAKAKVNCLDFADLEHFALKLLTEENPSGEKLRPSQTALHLRDKYKYIFVDEYQDINRVQQAILDVLSGSGNIFVVGDVKQSIYAFRGARPDIFLSRLKSACDENCDTVRIDLNSNFRSDERILDFVNSLFGRIMTSSFAGIDYDESAKLKSGLQKIIDDSEASAVEICILDEAGDDDDTMAKSTNRQRQAAMIAGRISQMIGADSGKAEFKVFDEALGCERDVEYRDIVILMRSPANKAHDYVEVLRAAGISVSSQDMAGYFQATEIRDCVSLLKVLDNPVRDIELACVLRSRFFNITDSQLTLIRLGSDNKKSKVNFYDCVVEYSQCGVDKQLAERLKSVLAKIEQWRSTARQGALADLLWQVYRETDYLAYVSAIANGQVRRANLLRLHDRAIQFENFSTSRSVPSLRRFVDFIEKLEEAERDWKPAQPAAAENSVRIMSVHKSKGLEFPVVFLAGLAGKFNKLDVQGDCLFDDTYALGLQIIDRETNTKVPSLTHQVVAEKKLATNLAEEMRILYVATTRAKNKLILSACKSKKHCAATMTNGFLFGSEKIDDWQLMSATSSLDWILLGLSNCRSLHSAFETGFVDRAVNDNLFTVSFYGQSQLGQLSDYILRQNNKGQSAQLKVSRKDSGLFSEIKTSLDWRYQFIDASAAPAKVSVTELVHSQQKLTDYTAGLSKKPTAVLAGKTDGRLIGTATHLLLAQIDLTEPVNEENIRRTLEKLLDQGCIGEAAAARINTDSIIKFFESDLGAAALDRGNRVWREWPFTFSVPADNWLQTKAEQSCDGETVIVQGIVDMLIETAKGLMVIDFKTDNITAEYIDQRSQLYRRQLELYSNAAEAILKTKLRGSWLYFLTPGLSQQV
jgi:ATP-dependent helicase/nuclease subunit A